MDWGVGSRLQSVEKCMVFDGVWTQEWTRELGAGFKMLKNIWVLMVFGLRSGRGRQFYEAK